MKAMTESHSEQELTQEKKHKFHPSLIRKYTNRSFVYKFGLIQNRKKHQRQKLKMVGEGRLLTCNLWTMVDSKSQVLSVHIWPLHHCSPQNLKTVKKSMSNRNLAG